MKPNMSTKNFPNFSPATFLTHSPESIKNRESLINMPIVHIPKYNASRCSKEPILAMLAAV